MHDRHAGAVGHQSYLLHVDAVAGSGTGKRRGSLCVAAPVGRRPGRLGERRVAGRLVPVGGARCDAGGGPIGSAASRRGRAGAGDPGGGGEEESGHDGQGECGPGAGHGSLLQVRDRFGVDAT